MAQYEHLQLVRLPERYERRKTGGGGGPPPRDPAQHSQRLRQELTAAIETQQRRRRPHAVNPALILRVRMTGSPLEEDWNQLGLTLLSSDADKNLVLFANSDEMREFLHRLDAYSRGTPADRKGPAFNNFIGGIQEIGSVEPGDRIGIRAREDGFTEAADFLDGVRYVVDVELWELGGRGIRETKLNDIVSYVESQNGVELDRYIGPAITMARFECDGTVVRNLLTVEEVSEVDFLPQVENLTQSLAALTLADIPDLEPVAPNAPLIGIIDSGVNDHPLIADIIVGAAAFPAELGTDDALGHGTKVAGISVFGDMRAQLAAGTLTRGARLCSARVLDESGNFPNTRLVPRQMRDAISDLNRRFDCRIFVIALGDRKKVYEGGKVGAWAATLDELARELNVVIIVSAGNRHPRGGQRVEEAVTHYPNYLTEPDNRLCEPAGAMNVVTVGAIAHSNGLSPGLASHVGVQPITDTSYPSPFTRVGPGLAGAIKPDFVDFGGTLIYDAGVVRLRGGEEVPEAGIMSLYHRPVDQLFTFASGTSYSTPLVAFKASQVLNTFRDASANLIRVLLASSAAIPPEAADRLAHLGDETIRHVCGHGQIDMEKAVFSDNDRVVFYAEDELAIDHFAVYQIPIPDAFQTTRGRRHIRVSLAYDPPVKHSRRDYAGVTMGYRLIRGATPTEIFERFRRRGPDDGDLAEMPARKNCDFDIGPTLREKSSLQTATATFQRDISGYGDTYYLMVRCAGGWSGDAGRQAFAVTVELFHEAGIDLYNRVRQRARVQV